MNKKIKYLSISDIHLGNKLNRTDNIVDNLRYFFRINHNQFKKLDIICIVGDTFDRLLINSSNDYILATEWLTELVLYCKSNSIKLRILEGTPSHDWNQAKLINTIIDKLKLDVDFKYIETLYIEQLDDLGIKILYVPDEYKHKASETYQDVIKLLESNNLSKVDIAFIHGQFHYQLPMVRLESSHNEEDYLNIVKYFISVGHIHTPSVYERILAQGSFDRLAHNEEEDKGAMLIEIDGINNKYNFIKNTKAMIFKTYRYDNIELNDMIVNLTENISKLPDNSNIRIISSNEEYLTKSLSIIKDKFSNMVIKIEKPKTKENSFKIIEDDKIIESFNITKDNIIELLDKEMHKHNFSSEELTIYKKELHLVIDSI